MGRMFMIDRFKIKCEMLQKALDDLSKSGIFFINKKIPPIRPIQILIDHILVARNFKD